MHYYVGWVHAETCLTLEEWLYFHDPFDPEARKRHELALSKGYYSDLMY